MQHLCSASSVVSTTLVFIQVLLRVVNWGLEAIPVAMGPEAWPSEHLFAMEMETTTYKFKCRTAL